MLSSLLARTSGSSRATPSSTSCCHCSHLVVKWCAPLCRSCSRGLRPDSCVTQPLSFIPEWIIRAFHYRDLWDLSPPKKGLFQGCVICTMCLRAAHQPDSSERHSTPVVNDEFLEHIRAGKISYKRGDTQSIVASGIRFNERERGSKSGDVGEETLISADVCVCSSPSLCYTFVPDIFVRRAASLSPRAISDPRSTSSLPTCSRLKRTATITRLPCTFRTLRLKTGPSS